ncbi:Transcriptional regulator, TetR family protein [Minicystis rosea]|nr:Transcriptional regulator, TetR family protein [Minicystis rosea]
MIEEPRTKARTKAPAKRRARRELVRGEPVVQRVLAATLEELGRCGYRALRMEDVALAAGVNKTTVYRRWPEKSGLVRDALSSLTQDVLVLPETGSLRGDLLALGRSMVRFSGDCQGQSIFRMLHAESLDPEVIEIKKAMRQRHEALPKAVLAAAVERGELAAGVDHIELIDAFIGAIHHKLFLMADAVTETFLERLANIVLYGALPRREGKRA